MARIGIL